jgi:hypothetical protein
MIDAFVTAGDQAASWTSAVSSDRKQPAFERVPSTGKPATTRDTVILASRRESCCPGRAW